MSFMGGLELPTLYQRIRVLSEGAGSAESEITSTFGRINSKATSLARGLTMGLTVPLAGMAVASVKMASDFMGQMEMIRTQAGASQQEVEKMATAITNIAGQVAQSPMALAQGLYHIESVGYRGKKALDILTAAAKEASLGHANLEDVTNALDATIVSHIGGIKSYTQAVAELNAIVGSGDMHMQDLADAFGTGILSFAARYGMTLKDVGAALATLGDNNIRGSKAATELRMTLSMMGAPSQLAVKAFNVIGLQGDQLAYDLRKPDGLLLALRTLHEHLDQPLSGSQFTGTIAQGRTALEDLGMSAEQAMQMLSQVGVGGALEMGQLHKYGLSAAEAIGLVSKHLALNQTQQAQILTHAFGGGRSSGPALILLGELDRVQAKYKAITAGQKNFAADWKAYTQTTQAQFAMLKDSADAFAISVGRALLPYVNEGMHLLNKLLGLFSKLPKPLVHLLEGGVVTLAIAAPAFLALQKVGSVLGDMGRTIGTVGRATGLLSKLPTMEDGLMTSPGKMGLLSKGVGALKDSFMSLGQTLGIVQGAQEGETAAMEETDVAMDANPIGAIIAILVVLAGVFYELYRHVKVFREAVNEVGRALKVAFVDSLHAVTRAFDDVFHFLKKWGPDIAIAILFPVGAAMYLVVKVIRDHWRAIVGFMSTVWHDIRAVVTAGANAIWRVVDGAWRELESMTRAEWNLIHDAIAAVWKVTMDVIRTLWRWIKEYLELEWEGIRQTWRQLWQNVLEPIGHLWSLLMDGVRDAWNALRDLLENDWLGLVNIWQTLWTNLLEPIENLWSTLFGNVQSGWNALSGWLEGVWQGFVQTVQRLWIPIWDALVAVWDYLPQVIGGAWQSAVRFVESGINDVIHLVNDFLKGIDDLAKTLHLGISIDMIPLLGGTSAAAAPPANSSLPPGLASGGALPMSGVGGGFKTNGPRAIVGEGRAAWPEYVIPTDPSYRGRALGLYQALGADLMASGGKIRHHGGWLSSIVGDVTGAVGAVGRDIAGFALRPIEGVLEAGLSHVKPALVRELGDAAVKEIFGGLGRMFGGGKAKGKGPAAGAGGLNPAVPSTPVTGSVADWFAQAMALTGVPKSWLAGLELIGLHESSFDPTAINNWDINAKMGDPSRGIMQTIMSTFLAYALPGRNAPADIWNPVDNIAAAIRYIQSRYGTIGNVPGVASVAAGGPYVGYAAGGMLPVRVYDQGGALPPGLSAVYNGTGGNEAVLTLRQMEVLQTEQRYEERIAALAASMASEQARLKTEEVTAKGRLGSEESRITGEIARLRVRLVEELGRLHDDLGKLATRSQTDSARYQTELGRIARERTHYEAEYQAKMGRLGLEGGHYGAELQKRLAELSARWARDQASPTANLGADQAEIDAERAKAYAEYQGEVGRGSVRATRYAAELQAELARLNGEASRDGARLARDQAEIVTERAKDQARYRGEVSRINGEITRDNARRGAEVTRYDTEMARYQARMAAFTTRMQSELAWLNVSTSARLQYTDMVSGQAVTQTLQALSAAGAAGGKALAANLAEELRQEQLGMLAERAYYRTGMQDAALLGRLTAEQIKAASGTNLAGVLGIASQGPTINLHPGAIPVTIQGSGLSAEELASVVTGAMNDTFTAVLETAQQMAATR